MQSEQQRHFDVERTNGVSQSLLGIARALSETRTAEQVASVIVGEVHDALGAASTVVYSCTGAGSTLARIASRGVLAAGPLAAAELNADAALPACDAVRDGEVWVASYTDLQARYPVLSASRATSERLQSLIALPLRQHHDVLGAVVFSLAGPLDESARDLAWMLVEQSSLALDRARQSNRQGDAAPPSSAPSLEATPSEDKFRAVFAAALDAMVLADDSRTLFDVNPAACELLGYTRAEMLGRHPQDFVAEDDHAGELWQRFRRDGAQRGEIRLRRRDGSLVAVEYTATANVFAGAHLAVWRDVDQRRRAERMLHFIADTGNELGRSLDYAATLSAVARLAVPLFADWAAVDLLNAQGLLQRVAEAPLDPAAGNNTESAAFAASDMTREVLETAKPALFSQLSDATWTQCVRSPDERERLRSLGVASLICVPLWGRGRVFGTVTLASALRSAFDASDLAVAEEVGRRASIALENATIHREAHEANELKDQFLGTVSHELRTPLNAILGWVTLLRNSKGNEVMLQRGLQVIERNAKAQARLIDDVLDVSRIVSGKLQLQCASLDLGEVVRAAMRVAAPSATLKGVVIEEGRCDAVSLVGDADRLQQVLWNLLSNAVKFTPAGGQVRVQIEALETDVVVRIADSGQGLAPEFLPYVFDRFRQADSSPTRRHEGLGLGLAIAKNLVELHGGVLSVESAGEGRGTTFSIRLPRTRELHVVQPPALTRTADAAEAFPCRLDGVRVLVCDDHDDARELVAWVLGACGASVCAVVSAREALAALGEFHPQVLVSDVCMPERDGYSLLREVRALPADAGGRTPAVALTSFARTEDVQRALAAGFQVHLPKPVDGAELVLAVARLAQGINV